MFCVPGLLIYINAVGHTPHPASNVLSLHSGLLRDRPVLPCAGLPACFDYRATWRHGPQVAVLPPPASR